jgi:selenide, water dikinase
MSPQDLAQVLCQLDKNGKEIDTNILVGFDLSDDAGVYQLSPELALVQTVDFFTPIVDDPYVYGQIAAANSLSDVYAMGGKPLTALAIACFSCSLDSEILVQILKGGEDKIKESNTALLGGHTVTDDEIKYGLSVTGVINPNKVVKNSESKPGDVLILTKSIGTGIITTAFKFDKITADELKEAVTSMTLLNKSASEAMQEVGVNSCTDITGFGLLGHTMEMAQGSKVKMKIYSHMVPIMAGVLDLAEKDIVPGGTYSNMRYFENGVGFKESVSKSMRLALFDPQTSGGLLISVPKERGDKLLKLINSDTNLRAEIIGEVQSKTESSKIFIEVQ